MAYVDLAATALAAATTLTQDRTYSMHFPNCYGTLEKRTIFQGVESPLGCALRRSLSAVPDLARFSQSKLLTATVNDSCDRVRSWWRCCEAQLTDSEEDYDN